MHPFHYPPHFNHIESLLRQAIKLRSDINLATCNVLLANVYIIFFSWNIVGLKHAKTSPTTPKGVNGTDLLYNT